MRQLVDAGIKAFLASPVPGYTDPAGAQVSYATAIKRGTTAYPYVISGGYLEKRVAGLEKRAAVDDVDDAAEKTEQDEVVAALHTPILPTT